MKSLYKNIKLITNHLVLNISKKILAITNTIKPNLKIKNTRKAKTIFAFALLLLTVSFFGSKQSEAFRNKKNPNHLQQVNVEQTDQIQVQDTPLSVESKPQVIETTAPKEPVQSAPINQPVITTPKPKTKTPVKNGIQPTAPAQEIPVIQAPPVEPVKLDNISQIIYYTNIERTKAGLQPVVVNSVLNQAAYAKSKHMAENNYFAHTAPDGTSDIYFINNAGYKYRAVGINLAEGDFGSNQGLVNAWMSSPGHKANILADYGQEIGIGIYGEYYTMIIGKPLN